MISKDFIGLGVAGNYPNHLQQINGEAEYASVTTNSATAPRGLFPWYVDNAEGDLGINPLSDSVLYVTKGANIHPEAELALDCDIVYTSDMSVDKLVPIKIGIVNDATERNDDKSVNEKKNWGKNSKGLCSEFIAINRFEEGSFLDYFAIVSWVKRDGDYILYNELCEMAEYMTFYGPLLKWLKDSLNDQKKDGPLDDLRHMLAIAGHPKQAIVSVGATKYTKFAETNYLSDGDIYTIALFDKRQYTREKIETKLRANQLKPTYGCLVLTQQVVYSGE